MKDKYYNLEASILSCLLQKPELMEKVVLEDKCFINYNKLWKFMKTFYEKFHNFDIVLMCSMTKPQYKFIMYIKDLINIEPIPEHFEIYQKTLIELFEEGKKEKWLIEKIYDLANELLVRKINTNEFREKVEEIYNNAEEIFKNE